MFQGNVVEKNARPVSQQKGEGCQENIGYAEQQPDFAMVASKHVRCQNTTGTGWFAAGVRKSQVRSFHRSGSRLAW